MDLSLINGRIHFNAETLEEFKSSFVVNSSGSIFIPKSKLNEKSPTTGLILAITSQNYIIDGNFTFGVVQEGKGESFYNS